MNSPTRSRIRFFALVVAVLALAAGCGSTTIPSRGPTFTPRATDTPVPKPTPLPNPVGSITLVGAVGEFEAGSRSSLAWQGVQEAAVALGATATQVMAKSPADLFAGIAAAAGPSASPSASPSAAPAGATVVVTVGPAGAQAALAAAVKHPSVVFFVLDQAIAEDAPANVHGLVFDDAEAGYLAGVVAGGVSSSGSVGFVAGLKGDAAAAGYLAGLRNGVLQASAAATVSPVYAGSSVDPQKGRAAVDGLVASGVGAIVTTSDLTGYGAMRQACSRHIPVVALETDAALLLPDVQPCLIVSILRRYDVAARDAIVGYANGRTVPRVAVGTVQSGGIEPSGFDNFVPETVSANLADVMAAMKAGAPRTTPGPVATPTSSLPASPVASGSA